MTGFYRLSGGRAECQISRWRPRVIIQVRRKLGSPGATRDPQRFLMIPLPMSRRDPRACSVYNVVPRPAGRYTLSGRESVHAKRLIKNRRVSDDALILLFLARRVYFTSAATAINFYANGPAIKAPLPTPSPLTLQRPPAPDNRYRRTHFLYRDHNTTTPRTTDGRRRRRIK